MAVDNHIHIIVFKYLHQAYPVKRLKDNRDGRFKRGIQYSDGLVSNKYFFRPSARFNELYNVLIKDLTLIFGLTKSEVIELVKEYISLNKRDIK